MSRGVHGSGSGGRSALQADSQPPEPTTDPESGKILEKTRPTPRPPLRGELLVRNGPVAGLRFQLRDGVVTVGRSSQCECPLHDEAVSRRHFELTVGPEGVHLRDLGSGNGTKLNAQPVHEARLHHGDRILAGNSLVEFREAEARSAASRGVAATPRSQRRSSRWVALATVGATLVAFVALAASFLWQRQRERQALATASFDRGRAELSHDPPDPDLALSDFLAAQANAPDHRALQDAMAEVRTVAAGVQQLTRARELAAQHNYQAALRELDGLPETPYFARTREVLAAEFIGLEAAPPEAPRQPVPTIRTLSAAERPARSARSGSQRHANEDRADELCDQGDALLARDPAGAKQKYREALRDARPGGTAARRAQAGLE